MKHQVLAPEIGESITEVTILKWHKRSGDSVRNGELLLEIESEKATVEIVAEHAGKLTITQEEGSRVGVLQEIAVIDDSEQPTQAKPAPKASPIPAPKPTAAAPSAMASAPDQHREEPAIERASPAASRKDRPGDRRVPMTSIRRRIAERLVLAQQQAAILTTFNEADMSALQKARKKAGIGIMPVFIRAAAEALKAVPEVNASIDGDDIVYHDYYDIGMAVGTDRGLVVPILRGAEKFSLKELDEAVNRLAERARAGTLSIPEMTGGTFTISNGGVYGSLLSTPILTPPQTGILGMHKIQDRPVAIDGKLEIRPMMYLALSYDHRLVDGKGAVTFLVTLKDYLEHPEKLGLEA